MRLRNFFIVLFCFVAIGPIATLWFWPYSHALNSEIEDVRERHLVIAKNLAGELERYHRDLIAQFDYLVAEIDNIDDTRALNGIFKNLQIRHICVANLANGRVVRSVQTDGPECPTRVPYERFEEMKRLLKDGQTVISGVYHSEKNGNVFYTLRAKGQQLYIGAVSTDYILETGKRIAFGEKGHAAIVDQNGRAISHPRPDWVESRFDMSKLGVVQKMLSGGTGVEQFYSPALKADMIAGYTHVAGCGWGVMVPQPFSELSNKAKNTETAAVVIMTVAVALATVLAIVGSSILLRPLERLIMAMRHTGNGDLDAMTRLKPFRFEPVELRQAREAAGIMADNLKQNMDAISQHAYIDSITGLPNRECFRLLSKETIKQNLANGYHGAMLFLDLDGFKGVNDIYGHRAGDELLEKFADALQHYCSAQTNFLRHKWPDVEILQARLGGDEFVVLISGLPSYSVVPDFANGMFREVFGQFTLHNNVKLNIDGSVGGAYFPYHVEDFDELLRISDIAMYQAKKSGKGCFCLYEPNNGGAAIADDVSAVTNRSLDSDKPINPSGPGEPNPAT